METIFFKPSEIINAFLLLLIEAYGLHLFGFKENTNVWRFTIGESSLYLAQLGI